MEDIVHRHLKKLFIIRASLKTREKLVISLDFWNVWMKKYYNSTLPRCVNANGKIIEQKESVLS